MSALRINIDSTQKKIKRADERIKELLTAHQHNQNIASKASLEREQKLLKLLAIRRKTIAKSLQLETLETTHDNLTQEIKKLDKDISKMKQSQPPIRIRPTINEPRQMSPPINLGNGETQESISFASSSPEIRLVSSPSNMRSPSPLQFTTSPPIGIQAVSAGRFPFQPMWSVKGNSKPKPSKPQSNPSSRTSSPEEISNIKSIKNDQPHPITISNPASHESLNPIQQRFSSPSRSRSENSLFENSTGSRGPPKPLWATKGNKKKIKKSPFTDLSSIVADSLNQNLQLSPETTKKLQDSENSPSSEQLEIFSINEYSLVNELNGINNNSLKNENSNDLRFTSRPFVKSPVPIEHIPADYHEELDNLLESSSSEDNSSNFSPVSISPEISQSFSRTRTFSSPQKQQSIFRQTHKRPMPVPLFKVKGNRKTSASKPPLPSRSGSSPNMLTKSKSHKKPGSNTPKIVISSPQDEIYEQSLHRSDSLPVVGFSSPVHEPDEIHPNSDSSPDFSPYHSDEDEVYDETEDEEDSLVLDIIV